jgi:hypothetical protein
MNCQHEFNGAFSITSVELAGLDGSRGIGRVQGTLSDAGGEDRDVWNMLCEQRSLLV